jgi:hypothetical protein
MRITVTSLGSRFPPLVLDCLLFPFDHWQWIRHVLEQHTELVDNPMG